MWGFAHSEDIERSGKSFFKPSKLHTTLWALSGHYPGIIRALSGHYPGIIRQGVWARSRLACGRRHDGAKHGELSFFRLGMVLFFCILPGPKDRALQFSQYFSLGCEKERKDTPAGRALFLSFQKWDFRLALFHLHSNLAAKLDRLPIFKSQHKLAFRCLRCFAMNVHVFRALVLKLLFPAELPRVFTPVPPLQ